VNKLPDDAYTFQDNEGRSYLLDAMRVASSGDDVVWMQFSDRTDNDPPAAAVMLSVERYDELLEKEYRFDAADMVLP